MSVSKGYFSLIQYCPDPLRLEAANIGVVLFCPEKGFLAGKTQRNNKRIIQFFGSEGHDWQQVNSFKKGIEHRLQIESASIASLQEFRAFISKRGNAIRISEPRSMRVSDPEKDLETLFNDLLSDRKSSESEAHSSGKSRLQDRFLQAGVRDRLLADIRVPVAISDRELHVPFAYQNGRFNLIEPVQFLAKQTSSLQTTAFRYAVEGESIFDNSHNEFGKQQLIVVGKFRPGLENGFDRVRAILKKHKVRLYSERDMDELVDDIKENAQPIPKRGLLF